MKIIFFGTPLFAAKVLSYLISRNIQVAAVVTRPDQPQGRLQKLVFNPVKKIALERGIPLFQPEKASDPSFAEKLCPFEADLFVVVAYGEIIKENLLKMPSLGCINLHASLLPKYRGAAPIQFALLNGDPETGITIIEMSAKMDAGAIIAKEKVHISEEMTFDELEAELCEAGSRKLLEVIRQFERGSVVKTPQDDSKATYVKKIDPSMAKIDWKEPAAALHHRIHAFSSRPGAWCFVEINGQTKRLKILRSSLHRDLRGSPGETLLRDKSCWIIACGEGALQPLEVQIEGKSRMPASDFLRGLPSDIRLL